MTMRRRHRGALLMEVMLALALFAAGGLAILALVRESMSSLVRARQTMEASNIARSAMARIEAGIDDPAMLVGPVEVWDGRAEAMTASDFNMSDDLPADETGMGVDPVWEIEVESLPSDFEGLSEVSVRAFRLASPGSERIVASYTLTQLVRLGALSEDVAGEEGELLEEALRGAGEER